MRVVVFPIAPASFLQHEEQVFRDHVRRGVQNSVARDNLFNPTTGLPLFFGQPHAQAFGTDDTFDVTGPNVLTYLPINTFTLTHPNLVDSGEFEAKYDMDVECTVSLYHPPPGGGSVLIQYTLYFSVWDGSSYTADVSTGAVTMEQNAGWHLNFSIMKNVTKGKMLRARVAHNNATTQIFDLTKSYISVKQLGIDPLAVGDSRT